MGSIGVGFCGGEPGGVLAGGFGRLRFGEAEGRQNEVWKDGKKVEEW